MASKNEGASAYEAAIEDIRLALKAGDMTLATKIANLPLSHWMQGGTLSNDSKRVHNPKTGRSYPIKDETGRGGRKSIKPLWSNHPKLWLLRPIDGAEPDFWEPWYDKAFGYIIRAETEKEAREIAKSQRSFDLPEEAWMSAKYSTCEVLKEEGEVGIIMEDFHAA